MLKKKENRQKITEKQRKRKQRVCSIIILLICVCININFVFVHSKQEELTVNFVKQGKSNWCWAASAENSVRYERKIKHTQKEAIKKLKGWALNPYPNIGGTPKDAKEAAEYISGKKENYSYVMRQKDFNFLKRQIYIQNVPIIDYGYFKGIDRVGGHMVVMIGYNDSSVSIKIYDSADGKKKWYNYNQLSNGTIKEGGLNKRYQNTIFNLDC